jgi:hypothetical protein
MRRFSIASRNRWREVGVSSRFLRSQKETASSTSVERKPNGGVRKGVENGVAYRNRDNQEFRLVGSSRKVINGCAVAYAIRFCTPETSFISLDNSSNILRHSAARLACFEFSAAISSCNAAIFHFRTARHWCAPLCTSAANFCLPSFLTSRRG